MRRKRAAGKVQKCIPLHAEQECKNIATGFPASRFTLDDRGELEQRQFWTFWLTRDESMVGNSIIDIYFRYRRIDTSIII